MFLSEAEVVELTHRTKGAWQARELEKLGIAYRRRSDGTLVVLRSALEQKQPDVVVEQHAPTREVVRCVTERKRFRVLPPDQLRGLPRGDWRTDGSGIYFYWRGPQLIYVGKSYNIGVRYKQHCNTSLPFTHMTYMLASTDNNRSFEGAYISRYNPPYNQRA